MKTIKFGNVVFSNTGVSYETPYSKPNFDQLPKVDTDKLFVTIKNLVRGRLHKCVEHLHKNVTTNVGCLPSGDVFFKDGSCFCAQSALAMQRILECKSIESFDMPMFKQAIKACVNPKGIAETNKDIYVSTTTVGNAIDYLMIQQESFISIWHKVLSSGLTKEFTEQLHHGATWYEAAREWDIL